MRVEESEIGFLDLAQPDDRARLLAAIRSAAETRDRELRDAVDSALGFIPKPLRGRIVTLLRARRG